MILKPNDQPLNAEQVASLLKQVDADLSARPFEPHRFLKHGDTQTIAAYLWPRIFSPDALTTDEERLFEIEPGSQVLAHCRWQPDRTEHPTVVIWHGMEGSTTSAYMLTMADKMFRRGFNAVRVNIRNCGGTEHLTPTLYHGGLTGDLRAVIDELITSDGFSQLYVAGFSLGGNMVLKLAGEYGDNPPREVKAVCAVSPSVNLEASTKRMAERRNWIYEQNFLKRLKRRINDKAKLFPELYDVSGLQRVRTVKQFDNTYTAPAFGFADADDYYARASSLPLIGRIRIPTLILHAKDDPFIPFEPLHDPSIAANPYVLVIAPERGGHVAFLSNAEGEDRFWAENRLVEFFEITYRSFSTNEQHDSGQ
jgi:predicted alpha/beta-fold hydrolase